MPLAQATDSSHVSARNRVGELALESDLRYFRRRAAAESLAAKRSMTPEGRARHQELAERYLAIVRANEAQLLAVG